MDFPSEEWVYNDIDDFDTASSNVRGDYTFELYAQLRPTGRMLDHFRCVLGGSKHLEINASLMDMIPNECFRGWRYRTQKSPSEINIRRNMFSTAWVETPTTLLFNEATVYNSAEQVVANDVFMGMLEDLPESGPETVATRYCIVIGADRRPALQFQSLPSSAVVLSGKAAFKG
jgi:hypothetical protein